MLHSFRSLREQNHVVFTWGLTVLLTKMLNPLTNASDPQGIWDNKTVSSSHENWYWAAQTLEAKQLSHFSQHNYFSIIKIKTSDWFPDFIFLVPVVRNRRSSRQSERVCVFIKINFSRIQFNKNTCLYNIDYWINWTWK